MQSLSVSISELQIAFEDLTESMNRILFLIDFMSTNSQTLREDIYLAVKQFGNDMFGPDYYGVSSAAWVGINDLIRDIENGVGIFTPGQLSSYFNQKYIQSGFTRNRNGIRWTELKPNNGKHYFIDFTQNWDLREIRQELIDFIELIGSLEFINYKIPVNVIGRINQLTAPNECDFYARICCPEDLDFFFYQKYIQCAFVRHAAHIKWMDMRIQPFLNPYQKYGAVFDLDTNPLVDFTLSNTWVVKLQFDRFIILAGETYSPNQALLRAKTMFLDRHFFGHRISGPKKICTFFSDEQNITRFACKMEHKIVWWDEGTQPTTKYKGDWDKQEDTHDMMDMEPWKCRNSLRKDIFLFELYRNIGNISNIESPLELMPPIYARCQGEWACIRPHLDATDHIYDIETLNTPSYAKRLPYWINDKFKLPSDDCYNSTALRSYLNSRELHDFPCGGFLSAENTIYCLVVYVPEFEKRHNRELDYESAESGPNPYQVYVGKASRGIVQRWVEARYAHTRVAKRLMTHTRVLKERGEEYRPYKAIKQDSGVCLPHALLALAKVRFYPTALFVLKSCSSKQEMDICEEETIRRLHARDIRCGLNTL